MSEVKKCLCGAEPIVEKKPCNDGDYDEDYMLFKYHCPNCKEKELPWLGQWSDCGALQEWNTVAGEKEYRKRTLEYNEHGVCVAEPWKILEWSGKKGRDKVTIEIFYDNDVYYYGYGYLIKNEGASSGLWISDKGFATLKLLGEDVMENLNKESIKEIVCGLVKSYIEKPQLTQAELF